MYNDKLDVCNKVISNDVLYDILEKMNEKILELNKICQKEKLENANRNYTDQVWTIKDFNGGVRCTFSFSNNTRVTCDKYRDIVAIFNSRLNEISSMVISFSCYYIKKQDGQIKVISDSIVLFVYENSMNINLNISSDNDKIYDVYQFIKDQILSAPERYDRVIKKRSSIINMICFSVGFIPSIIILTLLIFVPTVKMLYETVYILYPIALVIFSFMFGSLLIRFKLLQLYAPLLPNKKYVGYDKETYKSIYKDDIDNYVASAEIIIGKNCNNIKNREKILHLEKKCGSFLPIEIGLIVIFSIIVVFICKILS